MVEHPHGSPVNVIVNGTKTQVPAGTIAAAAIAYALAEKKPVVTRHSVTNEPRGPLCGMGICFECRATIDGQTNLRTCNILCREGMEIRTDG